MKFTNNSKSKNKSLSVIVLNWNDKKNTLKCIRSLLKSEDVKFKIIVVDNASTDGSVKYIKNIYPNIKIISNSKNLGYSSGNNVGIEYALNQRADYVLIVNNDIVMHKYSLNEMLSTLESDRRIGIVGPKVYASNSRVIQSVGARNRYFRFGEALDRNKIDNGKYKNIRLVDAIFGCAMLIKKDVFKKIGLLDKRFFLYFEDIDFCMRARKASYLVAVNPNAVVWHQEMGSSKRINPLIQYFIARNRFILAKSHFSSLQASIFSLLYLFYDLPKMLIGQYIKNNNIEVSKMLVKGSFDGLKLLLK